ncbi:unnamed protein product [Schistosoma curassoni]|uniref:Uncharacterized protein n=1 Tax=Schistosoma curassoni TaxID=6186 RepID=A0A183KTU2_9TREM|nr:unnamed protein product [Schistosoma curassoni]
MFYFSLQYQYVFCNHIHKFFDLNLLHNYCCLTCNIH